MLFNVVFQTFTFSSSNDEGYTRPAFVVDFEYGHGEGRLIWVLRHSRFLDVSQVFSRILGVRVSNVLTKYHVSEDNISGASQ